MALSTKNKRVFSEKGKPSFKNRKNALKKGLAGIFLILCLTATCAMVADLYFTRFRSGTTELSSGNHRDSSSIKDHGIQNNDNIINHSSSQGDDGPIETPFKALERENGDFIHADNAFPSVENKGLVNRLIFEVFDDEPVKKAKPHTSPSGDSPSQLLAPRVAIIIDDIGFDMEVADDLAALNADITMSIMPAAPFAVETAKQMHAKGLEIMLHLPMEPVEYPEVDPGPGAILSTMSPDEVLETLRMNLDALPYIKGVNNHMGSAITALSPQMHQIFTVLKKRDLFFIDSLTSKFSLCSQAAGLLQIPFAYRDVFLDNIQEKSYIKKKLKELVAAARMHGTAIGICHPYPVTCLTLKDEMPALKKQVRIVPASSLVAVPYGPE